VPVPLRIGGGQLARNAHHVVTLTAHLLFSVPLRRAARRSSGGRRLSRTQARIRVSARDMATTSSREQRLVGRPYA
jgi:hypothetical protein